MRTHQQLVRRIYIPTHETFSTTPTSRNPLPKWGPISNIPGRKTPTKTRKQFRFPFPCTTISLTTTTTAWKGRRFRTSPGKKRHQNRANTFRSPFPVRSLPQAQRGIISNVPEKKRNQKHANTAVSISSFCVFDSTKPQHYTPAGPVFRYQTKKGTHCFPLPKSPAL